MLKFRLLTENEMKEMSKYGFGKIPKVTDFAILSGISGNYLTKEEYYNLDRRREKDRYRWLLSSDICVYHSYVNDKGEVLDWGLSHSFPAAVDRKGNITYAICNEPGYGIRPVTVLNEDIAIGANIIDENIMENEKFLVLQYGEYIRDVVDEDLNYYLDKELEEGNIFKTSKEYYPYWRYYDVKESYCRHMPIFRKSTNENFQEYLFNGKKFVVVRTNKNSLNIGNKLHDDRRIEPDKSYWLMVEPIQWTLYMDNNLMVADEVLLCGEDSRHCLVHSPYRPRYNFDNTDNMKMDNYLNKVFAKDIIPSNSLYKKEFPRDRDSYKKLVKLLNN